MLVEQRQENQTQRLSYSAFSLDMVRQRFTIEIHLQRFFAHIPRVDATELLRASLARASTSVKKRALSLLSRQFY